MNLRMVTIFISGVVTLFSASMITVGGEIRAQILTVGPASGIDLLGATLLPNLSRTLCALKVVEHNYSSVFYKESTSSCWVFSHTSKQRLFVTNILDVLDTTIPGKGADFETTGTTPEESTVTTRGEPTERFTTVPWDPPTTPYIASTTEPYWHATHPNDPIDCMFDGPLNIPDNGDIVDTLPLNYCCYGEGKSGEDCLPTPWPCCSATKCIKKCVCTKTPAKSCNCKKTAPYSAECELK